MSMFSNSMLCMLFKMFNIKFYTLLIYTTITIVHLPFEIHISEHFGPLYRLL